MPPTFAAQTVLVFLVAVIVFLMPESNAMTLQLTVKLTAPTCVVTVPFKLVSRPATTEEAQPMETATPDQMLAVRTVKKPLAVMESLTLLTASNAIMENSTATLLPMHAVLTARTHLVVTELLIQENNVMMATPLTTTVAHAAEEIVVTELLTLERNAMMVLPTTTFSQTDAVLTA